MSEAASEVAEAAEQQEYASAECSKILCATDIRLGYKGKDDVLDIDYFACNNMIV